MNDLPGMGANERLAAAAKVLHGLLREVPWDGSRALAARLVDGAVRQANQARAITGWAPFIDLPFDVIAAAGGDPALAPRIAAACMVVFGSFDVIDDVADGDCQPQWRGVPASQQNLAGVTGVACHAPLLIARLPIDAVRKLAMLETMARELLLASEGQRADLALAGGAPPGVGEVEASAEGKSGAQLALYCEWAALAAGAGDERVRAWGQFGRALGAGWQIRSDISELCHDDWCRDLASGKRTLPIAYHLAREDRHCDDFVTLLGAARNDRGAQLEVRRALMASGSIRFAVFHAQCKLEQARTALRLAAPAGPAASRLEALLAPPGRAATVPGTPHRCGS